MSLTSLLDRKNARIEFGQAFPVTRDVSAVPCVPMKAHPQTTNYALVGVAFDYAMRWVLMGECPDYKDRSWVAESALAMVGEGWGKQWRQNAIDPARNLTVTVSTFDEDVARLALLIAQLDDVIRKGIRTPYSVAEDIVREEDCLDLVALVKLIPASFFSQKVVLNPVFGNGSVLVGGADADFIAGSTLVDIKTTKYLSMKPEYYHQLIGYVILSKLGGIHPQFRKTKIDRLGIYFSRHGLLHSFPVPDISDEFIERFEKYAQSVMFHWKQRQAASAIMRQAYTRL